MRLQETHDPFINKHKIKGEFYDYLIAHTPQQEGSKISIDDFSVTDDGLINSGVQLKIVDHQAPVLPFKFYNVQGMVLMMPNLRTLDGCPKHVNSYFHVDGNYNGSRGIINVHLNNLVGCPATAKHVAFVVGCPVINLNNSLTENITSLFVESPEIKSFQGLNVDVEELSFNCSQQKSISGIHKQLRNKIGMLTLGLPDNFSGGLLSLALMRNVRQIDPMVRTGKRRWMDAFEIIVNGRRKNENVHDIQEQLIDANLREFATL